MFYIYSDTITISVILRRLRILHHVSSVPDVPSYGLLAPLAIDTKRHVAISASMNSLGDIARKPKTYLKIYPNDSKRTNSLITTLHMILKVY
jgi:hypothetical protein